MLVSIPIVFLNLILVEMNLCVNGVLDLHCGETSNEGVLSVLDISVRVCCVGRYQ